MYKNMALHAEASGLAMIALIADRATPTFGFVNIYARLRPRPTRDHVQRAMPPPRPRRSRPDNTDESSAELPKFSLEVAREANPEMTTAGSISHDVSCSHPATRGEYFDVNMATLAACRSEEAVFHLRNMRMR